MTDFFPVVDFKLIDLKTVIHNNSSLRLPRGLLEPAAGRHAC